MDRILDELRDDVALAKRIIERVGLSHAFGHASARVRGHGITTAFPDVRSATVAACYLEESAVLQLRMLAAASGNAAKIRAFTREEGEGLRDQVRGNVAKRAWEYFAAVARENPLGSGQR